MYRILIVEDEEPISDLIKLNLEMAGFETDEALDGRTALEKINKGNYDLVILDIMLPRMNGYELLPYIKEKDKPVIMLTAKDALKDKIMGLDLGADDYLTKPFENPELVARVKALLRRKKGKEGIIKFDNVEVDLTEKSVSKNGEEIEVTPKEFELLVILIQNKGIVLTREKLLKKVWNYDYLGDSRTIDMHIQRLRKKLDTEKITTIYKVGYRLEE
ncbi:response regulator transcription factor [Clostridium grantii]|uniref:Stage 0 sporulation protein A homolog n=1 Tax=Clostridium grantii DSM 8605 TaxID=1121316 RepID=A0A1M5RK29_9CLOT|nr:response regulator transcription factor [Clostridium grantii]SHH26438.1 DNA-binding response regulator, OmpR family, contains REC and winged-helix (wHTH) domain [Clostridium grantii DSM 8605]